jgi:NADPH2:quinone reductase
MPLSMADNLREALRRLTGERGVDVVYDAVGGDLAEPAMRALGWKGRFRRRPRRRRARR